MTAQLKARWFVALATVALSTVTASILSSCSTSSKSTSSSSQQESGGTSSAGKSYGPPEPYGPKPDSQDMAAGQPSGPEPAPAYGPEPVQIRPVVLVLGPGRARGFAHAGAIRALADAKIPVGAIFASEVGSLIGGIYAMDGKVNQLDWALLRFKDDVLKLEGRLFSGILGGDDRLTAELEKVFGQKDLSQAKVPVRIAIHLDNAGAVTIVDRGPAVQAIRASLGTSSRPGRWNGVPASSAGGARPFQVSEAVALGIGPVVVIDTSIQGASSVAVSGADIVIRPEMRGIQDGDYLKRTEAVFAGKKAVIQKLNEIRQRVGLPQATGSDFEKASANQ